MANPTMVKFGYPASVVAETAHWSVLLRPQQPTLGSLVVVCRDEARAFGELSPETFADLRVAVSGVERVLRRFVSFERINYLMLMMVDPDVHFHAIPRYSEPRQRGDTAFRDAGWPGVPVLGEAVTLGAGEAGAIRDELAALWHAS